jgi:hypothetical protein
VGKSDLSRGGDSTCPFCSPFFTKGASTRASTSILDLTRFGGGNTTIWLMDALKFDAYCKVRVESYLRLIYGEQKKIYLRK